VCGLGSDYPIGGADAIFLVCFLKERKRAIAPCVLLNQTTLFENFFEKIKYLLTNFFAGVHSEKIRRVCCRGENNI
jgi:hypothetical protein